MKKIYLRHYTKGVKFLGTFIKPYRIYIANRAKGNIYDKIGQCNELLQTGKNKISRERAASFIVGANSYLGLLGHYRTAKLRQKMMSKLSVYFWNYAYFKIGGLKTAKKEFVYLFQRTGW